MSSSLISLDDTGALKTMFSVEGIDTDRGIIAVDGYIGSVSSLLGYAGGAYSDSYGLTVANKLFGKINIKIKSTERPLGVNSARLFLDLPSVPDTMNSGFYFPKVL